MRVWAAGLALFVASVWGLGVLLDGACSRDVEVQGGEKRGGDVKLKEDSASEQQ